MLGKMSMMIYLSVAHHTGKTCGIAACNRKIRGTYLLTQYAVFQASMNPYWGGRHFVCCMFNLNKTKKFT
jgi:hypothetical protein